LTALVIEENQQCATPKRADDAAAGGALGLSRDQVARVEEHARAAYPEECCGVLVGWRGERTVVLSVHPAGNRSALRARDRYQVDPRQILQLSRGAEGEGREIVGFYHSHPDYPARPSAIDAAQAWPGYVYLIVGVGAATEIETRAWSYDESLGEFRECPIVLDPGAGQPSAAPGGERRWR
jgi:proteasome lid subunit RPN8/RPN11